MPEPGGPACLNCGADLAGPFCAACGQRAVPANPTVSELAGDAWQELSGYDGRIMSTFRALLRPGRLTAAYLQGRRARYLPPIRLYLIVSVVYFVTSAAVPPTADRSQDVMGPGGMRIQITDSPESGMAVTPESREAIMNSIARAPWWLRPLFRSIAEDAEAFRGRVLTVMPRVFFALLPVFAAIVALFYRGRTFPTALVFAAHLHAFAFVIFTISELSKITQQPLVMGAVSAIAIGTFVTYVLLALRTVYGGGWALTVAKALGIGVVYLFASIPAFIVILAWASLT